MKPALTVLAWLGLAAVLVFVAADALQAVMVTK
jgi:hypothetical protein